MFRFFTTVFLKRDKKNEIYHLRISDANSLIHTSKFRARFSNVEKSIKYLYYENLIVAFTNERFSPEEESNFARGWLIFIRDFFPPSGKALITEA